MRAQYRARWNSESIKRGKKSTTIKARLIDVAAEFVHAVDAVGNQIPRSAVGNAMPRRKRIKLPPRIALPAPELESKIMAMLRGLKECARLKGVGFVHVGSFGQEPNWFARPLPSRISEACRRAFVTALATVRKEFDLLFPQRFGTEESSPSNNNGGSRSRP
jgi:hypothetical protein